uniref:Ornithine aminotransferase n=1 Tax=Strombidium rassoulzadegani TaxID=1082188 RepID=A0A7S3CQ06_9SPIT|mmetsp:Transcript_2981/g.5046  ORF Transcript_2981/g.5046 Transcript_2981/m.5046 type:complete len:439 (+) Transcript_2981:47-1363(+)|eukprot:CAMPEP_0168614320 /NCGR_PEP_ID=MMETSP0449_2-20121227/3912_1 /TAXON_ID=1082188 /ORGANISM="Strombidium rassoulzadegani, Strain ras09" /LENGTH=438 /DNA_ID=CAMNT_0008654993 /DNA_START=21 /DNA_END=1337 /DNA_ORIENTATION=+
MISKLMKRFQGAQPLTQASKSAMSVVNSNQHYLEMESKYVCNNYLPLPIVADRGERIYIWDVEGNKYYDFLCGYSSTNQGHCHPKIVKALVDQASKITQTSRAFCNPEMPAFSKYITELLGYEKFLPSSTGVEACESACKLARRWGYVVKKVEKDKASILMANGCFWGRSITACSGSDDFIRYNNFGPLTPGFPLVDFNDLEGIENYLKSDPNCVGVMLEPIQGEGGVIIPQEGYLSKVKQLCKKYNVLLITDEVQTGLGRTGKLMGYNHDLGDDRPDIVTLGKAISGGVTPVSGILAKAEVMDTIKAGDHGSTYGGNPLGMAVAKAAVSAIVEEGMVENSEAMGKIFAQRLSNIDSDLVKEVRSRGLFCGLEFKHDLNVDGNHFAKVLMKNGLITKATHKYCVRFAPALVINEEEVHAAADIIEKSMVELEEMNSKM